MIKKLIKLTNKRDRIALIGLLFLGIVLSLIEVIGISAIMPFINLIANPDIIVTNRYFSSIYTFFSYSDAKAFTITFGAVLIFFYIFRAIFIMYYTYLLNRFTLNKYKNLVNIIFLNYLHLPYKSFLTKNSSEMLKVIITDAGQLAALTINSLTLLIEILIVLVIYIILIMVDIKMTIIVTILLGMKVYILTKTISKKIKSKGIEKVKIENDYYRIISESLSNFKFIKFVSEQEKILEKFQKVTETFSYINIYNNTLQTFPKVLLESFGFSLLIGVIIYLMISGKDASTIITIITIYSLALYRILPAVTKILNSYNNILFHSKSLDIVYVAIQNKPTLEFRNPITFNYSIRAHNLKFGYNEKHTIINNLSLEIKKGAKVAFIGRSGSGKSTLVDILCGIFKPDSGEIYIDDEKLTDKNIVSWRMKMGYIPQSIYLFDGTISENISFGRELDKEKLIKVLKQANIYDTIMEKDGLDTMVGEGGIQLSGGQKQRIGIARALYGDPEVLVLDEATSALDTKTEKAIMDEIYKVSEDKTLLIIAHRLSTINKCDMKIDIEKIN